MPIWGYETDNGEAEIEAETVLDALIALEADEQPASHLWLVDETAALREAGITKLMGLGLTRAEAEAIAGQG